MVKLSKQSQTLLKELMLEGWIIDVEMEEMAEISHLIFYSQVSNKCINYFGENGPQIWNTRKLMIFNYWFFVGFLAGILKFGWFRTQLVDSCTQASAHKYIHLN